jgi:hypothetical protein
VTTRVVIELATSDTDAVVQLLRRLLKVLGRRHGLRCTSITATKADA